MCHCVGRPLQSTGGNRVDAPPLELHLQGTLLRV
jgi:hypothetical protein